MYQKLIRDILQKIGRSEVAARHVEGWMRLQFRTLDHLSRAQFVEEVKLAVACIDAAAPGESEELARSYGL